MLHLFRGNNGSALSSPTRSKDVAENVFVLLRAYVTAYPVSIRLRGRAQLTEGLSFWNKATLRDLPSE